MKGRGLLGYLTPESASQFASLYIFLRREYCMDSTIFHHFPFPRSTLLCCTIFPNTKSPFSDGGHRGFHKK